MDFENRTAILTGAATGIGETIARRLAAGGAQLVLVGHDPQGLHDVQRSVDPSGTRVRVIAGDVRDPECMPAAVEIAENELGGLHIAVNNAGRTGPPVLLEDLAIEDWEEVLATNLTGMFLGMKAQLPALVRSGGGAILNLSSGNGIVGVPHLAAYTASKHAVVGLTRSAALDYADKNIRINCIAPGYVATPRMLDMPAETLAEFRRLHPMGRLASPEEVAELAAFLVSDRASFCTGGFYPVDGGYTAQ